MALLNNTSTAANFRLKRNGILLPYVGGLVGVSGAVSSGSTLVPDLKTGETIQFVIDQSISVTGGGNLTFSLEKLSGSPTISATEEISVIATNASVLSIGINTTISGWVKEFDSTGSFNQTTGVFTAPTAGRYEFNGFITFDTTSYSAGKEYSLALNRTGSVNATYPLASFYPIINSTTNNYLSINGSTIVDLKGGDTVSFIGYQNDGSKSLLGNSRFNRITIKKVK